MRIGVDLGGTKIEAIALDRDGRERGRRRVSTPRDRYAATLATITTLVEGLERESGEPSRVGIGMPGALSPATGLVKNANSVWLNGRPLRQDLERLLHRPLRFANDANCFALSEARDGAGAGARTVFGVILGTGTGGGIVVDGRALTGPNADRRRVGPQPAPLASLGRVAGSRLLLRTNRMRRDVPLRTRARARPPGGHGGDARRRDHRGARRRRRRALRGDARPLRGAPRAGAGRRRQRPRSGRHRAGRRPLEPGPPLRRGAGSMGRLDVLGPRRHSAAPSAPR